MENECVEQGGSPQQQAYHPSASCSPLRAGATQNAGVKSDRLSWLLLCREARETPIEGPLFPLSVHPYLAGMMATASAAKIAVQDFDFKPNT